MCKLLKSITATYFTSRNNEDRVLFIAAVLFIVGSIAIFIFDIVELVQGTLNMDHHMPGISLVGVFFGYVLLRVIAPRNEPPSTLFDDEPTH